MTAAGVHDLLLDDLRPTATPGPGTPAPLAVDVVPYDTHYYNAHREGTRRSAQAVVPLLIDLIRPHSIIDVGCGTGVWLSVFEEYGVQDVVGVDGPWVHPDQLEIAPERFVVHDLAKPLSLGRSFDLVLCLEVAEHLPPEAAATLVETLTQLGSLIVFSAAVPNQGGESHLNEAWPDYWLDLFAQKNYNCLDGLRSRIWKNCDVEVWYKQNIFIYGSAEKIKEISKPSGDLDNRMLSIIHPELFEAQHAKLAAHAHSLYEDWKSLLAERQQLREQKTDLQRRLDAAEATLARIRNSLPGKILRAARRSGRYLQSVFGIARPKEK